MTESTIHSLGSRLLNWFRANARDLPWRESYAPYEVWISEIMLQQTQMDRAVHYFTRWMGRFPDVQSLAAAHEDEVLKLWEGLGYYSRARNLLKAARLVAGEPGARLPRTFDGWLALPGVGKYTAAAVMSLAFNEAYPVVDANVERVFSRLFDLDVPVKDAEAQRFIRDTAGRFLESGEPRLVNQALMEFGALVCSKKPACSECVLRDSCESFRLGIPHERPVPGKKQDIIPIRVATGVILHQGRAFIQKRRPDDVWGGLWEFPGGVIEEGETPGQAVVREVREELGFEVDAKNITVIKHGYTRYRVTLHCFACRLNGPFANAPAPPRPPHLAEATECTWADLKGLNRYAFPAGHRKLIDRFQNDPDYTAYFNKS